MLRRTIPLLFVFTISAFLGGHKAAAAVYDDTSITVRPSADSYGNSDQFVRDSIIYLYPRSCVYYQKSDGIRSGENQKPGKFNINSIIQNAEKDGWYLSYVQPVFAAHNALSFYFNKDTGEFSCTGRGVNFQNGRWLDLDSLPVKPIQSAAVAGQGGAASGKRKGRLSYSEVFELLWGNTEVGTVRQPSRPEVEGDSGQTYKAYYQDDYTVWYKLDDADDVKRWDWYILKTGVVCRGPDRLAKLVWCRAIARDGAGRYKGVGFRSGNLRYQFRVEKGLFEIKGIRP